MAGAMSIFRRNRSASASGIAGIDGMGLSGGRAVLFGISTMTPAGKSPYGKRHLAGASLGTTRTSPETMPGTVPGTVPATIPASVAVSDPNGAIGTLEAAAPSPAGALQPIMELYLACRRDGEPPADCFARLGAPGYAAMLRDVMPDATEG